MSALMVYGPFFKIEFNCFT
uniref:Uncharacterized protein n=1 Tax=Rhizophora mucronata TaxID=61149 RepID=A0A2P2N8A1_RHIMU